MAHFIIAGKPDCKNFYHARHVGLYLHEHLPKFSIQIIEKRSGGAWEQFLEDTNKAHGWYHTESPIIWKELASRGGRAYLLGSLSEFWEYCYDYYGLQSRIPKDELIKLTKDHMKQVLEKEELEKEKLKKTMNILISGACNPLVREVILHLVQVEELECEAGVNISLFERYSDFPENVKFLSTLIDEFKTINLGNCNKTIKEVFEMREGLQDCDLLVVADCFTNVEAPDIGDVIVKKVSLMYQYADEINVFAKRNLRIVVIGDGVPCLCGTILVESCTRIRVHNIVVVTSNVGLSSLSIVSRHTGIPVKELGGPPVYGFIGMNEYVDVESIVKYCKVYVPYSRSITATEESTLLKGKVKPELRFLAYAIKDSDLVSTEIAAKSELIRSVLNRAPHFAMVRSFISLLKIWYSKEERDEIISLGVCSNGAFGIPHGIVFSQPAILNHQKMWVPFEMFPISQRTQEEIEKLIPPVRELLDNFGIVKSHSEHFQITKSEHFY